MSIADEIIELKKLLDSGILSNDEYEGAKQGLLNKISVPTNLALRQDSFVGKWRRVECIESEGGFLELELLHDGKAKAKMRLKNDNGGSRSESAVMAIMGIMSGTGKWWLDQSELIVTMNLGNALGRIIIKGLENADAYSSSFRVKLLAVSPQEIRGVYAETTNEVRFLRLGVK